MLVDAGSADLRVAGARADTKYLIQCSNFKAGTLVSASKSSLSLNLVAGETVYCSATLMGASKKRQDGNAEIFPVFTPIANFTVGSVVPQNVSPLLDATLNLKVFSPFFLDCVDCELSRSCHCLQRDFEPDCGRSFGVHSAEHYQIRFDWSCDLFSRSEQCFPQLYSVHDCVDAPVFGFFRVAVLCCAGLDPRSL